MVLATSRALVDHIYAALLGESTWQAFLDDFSRVVPNGMAFFGFHDAGLKAGAMQLCAGVEATDIAAYNSYFAAKNPWMPAATTRPVAKVVRTEAMLPREALARTEYYNDFLRRLDVRTGVGVTILREEGCNSLFSLYCAEVEDSEADKAARCMQDLVPHLRRAFDYYRRNPEGDPASGAGLSDIPGIGIVRLGRGGTISSANPAAAALLSRSGALQVDCMGRFRCQSTALMEHLDAVLGAWAGPERKSAARSFLVPVRDEPLPLRITVVTPAFDAGRAFFIGPECILLIEDCRLDTDAAAEEFGRLHGLTAAERRIAASVAEGFTIEQIAARSKVSTATVRVQMRSIFAKTGLHRQVDLVRHVCALARRLAREG